MTSTIAYQNGEFSYGNAEVDFDNISQYKAASYLSPRHHASHHATSAAATTTSSKKLVGQVIYNYLESSIRDAKLRRA